MRQGLKGYALGRFIRFAWLVMSRSVAIETVSISGMYFYIQITRRCTSIKWYSLLSSGVEKCQDLGNQSNR